MRTRAHDSPVDDGWRGARIGAEARDRARREASRIDAAIDIGEPGRPRVTLAFLAAALLATILEFAAFGVNPTASELSRSGGAGIGVVATGAWWKLLTSNLLHAHVPHLLMNCFVIYLTGRWLEHLAGRLVVMATIAWSMLLAGVGSLLVDAPTVSIGASGVAFGLVGCAIGIDPRARTATGIIGRQLAIVNVIVTFLIPGISIGGHFGGLLAGVVVGWVAWRSRPSEQHPAGRARRAVAVGALAAALPVAAIMAVGPRALPGEARDERADLGAWLLERQLAGATLSSGREIDDATCRGEDGDPLTYRCRLDGEDDAIVRFAERDDQWTLRTA